MPEHKQLSITFDQQCDNEQEIHVKIPKWLNGKFLQKALQIYEKEKSIKITKCHIQSATAKGENFASCIFRLICTYSSRNTNITSCSFIIKSAYEDELALKILFAFNVYEKEMEIYQKILPDITRMLERVNFKEKIFAESIYICFQNQAMVLEDLLAKDYRAVSAQEGLDLIHCKLALDSLAKFHAASAVLGERNKDVFRHYKGMLCENSTFSNLYMTSFDALLDVVSQWDNYEYYKIKLQKLKPSIIKNGQRLFEVNEKYFNCLIHGDLWANNIFYRYNASSEHPVNCIIIDFQFSCWGSPAIDLQYFFNTSLKNEIRFNYQDELIKYYHTNLINTLNSLNYRSYIPNLLEFHTQFIEMGFYGLITAFLIQPIMINECNDDADILSLHGTDDRALSYKKFIYSTNKVHENIRYLLPIFDKNGLLD